MIIMISEYFVLYKGIKEVKNQQNMTTSGYVNNFMLFSVLIVA